MFGDKNVRKETAKFVCVIQNYDGLNGKVIKWANEHGNTNHDPSVLAWVLDPKGKELGRAGGRLGSASGFAAWLREMSRASFPLVDPAAYKILKSEAKAIAQKKKLGAVLADLRSKAGSESEEAQEEAKSLLAKLLTYANFQLERALKLKETAPSDALILYKRVGLDFKGDEIGKQATETYKALRKNKAFQREIKAGAIYHKMKELRHDLKPKRPLDSPSNRKIVKALHANMQAMERYFPKTRMIEKARELMKTLGK